MEFNATFLASIISFLVFVYLMNKVLYAPMEKIVRERASYIDDNFKVADENNKKVDALTSEKEQKLANAKEDAKSEYISKIADYKEKRADIIKNAQIESSTELEKEYENLDNVSNEVKANLRDRMADLANDIVEKVLGYRSEVQGFDNDTVNRILYH